VDKQRGVRNPIRANPCWRGRQIHHGPTGPSRFTEEMPEGGFTRHGEGSQIIIEEVKMKTKLFFFSLCFKPHP